MDFVKNSIDAIRNLRMRLYFNEQFLPSVIEHRRRNDSQFSNLLEQLWGTENVLCHLSISTLEARRPLLRGLDCVVGKAITLVNLVCSKFEDWTGRRDHDAREHYLEVFLDLRWWTWVVIYKVGDKFLRTLWHGERFLITPKGVFDPASSRLPSFMQKLYLWWSRYNGYVRHLPSYGIEVFLQETEGPSSLLVWLLTEIEKPFGKSDISRGICTASAATFIVDEELAPVLHSRKPLWVGDELKVDLTHAVLGMSNSGLVIKCQDSGTGYALKRVQNLNQKPPVIARLCHPHFVQLMSYWRENGFLFLLMELMEGDLKDLITIRSRTEKSSFPMNEVLDMLLQIAKAMLYLHDMGLTYSHLESSDVLFKKAGVHDKNNTEYLLKLGDFQFYPKKHFESMAPHNVYQFGLICLEVLSMEPLDWEFEERVMTMSESPKLRFHKIQNQHGYSIPGSLTQCITSCLDGSIKFSEVVVMLLLAQIQEPTIATKKTAPSCLDCEIALPAKLQDDTCYQSPVSSPRFTMIPEAEIGEGTSVEDEIEQSKVHRSQLVEHYDFSYGGVGEVGKGPSVEDEIEQFWDCFSDVTDDYDSDGVTDDSDSVEEVAEVSNVEVFKSLQRHPTWGHFFCTFGDGGIHNVGELLVRRKFAEGALADLYDALVTWQDPKLNSIDQELPTMCVLKVFTPPLRLLQEHLCDLLQKCWPKGMFGDYVERVELAKFGKSPRLKYIWLIHCGTLLADGRFAILGMRATEDLLTLIHRRMMARIDLDCGPFSMVEATNIMFCVASGMGGLHNLGIVHRDLKPSNILCNPLPNKKDEVLNYDFLVADYEFAAAGVVGTGFFRAPEILQACKERNVRSRPNLFTKAVDVYAYGMLSYHILTGKLPFEDHSLNEYDLVLQGRRPELPHFVDEWTRELLHMCWQSDPAARPTFGEILDFLEANSEECKEIRRRDDESDVTYERKFQRTKELDIWISDAKFASMFI